MATKEAFCGKSRTFRTVIAAAVCAAAVVSPTLAATYYKVGSDEQNTSSFAGVDGAGAIGMSQDESLFILDGAITLKEAEGQTRLME